MVNEFPIYQMLWRTKCEAALQHDSSAIRSNLVQGVAAPRARSGFEEDLQSGNHKHGRHLTSNCPTSLLEIPATGEIPEDSGCCTAHFGNHNILYGTKAVRRRVSDSSPIRSETVPKLAGLLISMVSRRLTMWLKACTCRYFGRRLAIATKRMHGCCPVCGPA